VKEVLNNYKIKNLSAFIGNSTIDNNTLVEFLIEDFDIDPVSLRIRYLGYIINLIVKAYLFSDGFTKLEITINALTKRD
jgi:hypothetical protein